ncbi:chromate resistance protein ChrB domain-containing protein [Caballeronia cordobensis]|uniref:chromate resistance protein ChrB domain-containing protein n=1 Tax=Caballeronia cordobensis TaxID=1353886 RepID=UPI0006AD7F2B|nr:chromate resistance protein ChrB domain-containing protein [Caballeronia cordobensis]
MNGVSTWSLLILTLPTENATARMRFWRALKAKGCAVLRDGIYLLPFTVERETALRELATAIGESGGTAHLLRAPGLDQEQEAEFRDLFDRSNDYDALIGALSDARKIVFGQAETELRRLMQRLRKDYESIIAIDFFPTEAATRAEVAWQDFVTHVDTVMSPGEPHPAEREVRTLTLKDYRGRTWATRQRIWVDRVASAWLIRRFIDPDSRFIWLPTPDACPLNALGFDFDGAAFTHVGERVTFEVLMASFKLESDSALLRLAAMVHALDVGGAPVPEAIGFEAIMAGARERTADDDALLDEISRVLDSMYTHFTAVARSADQGGRS